MKTLTIEVLKKNRVYFKCIVDNYEVKLLIDENSQNLDIGKHDLLVEDISVRTKYGTDIIYKLAANIDEQKRVKNNIVTLNANYNYFLVEECRKLGGRWDSSSKTWVFSAIVEEEVEELDEIYNSELITVEITAKRDCYAGKSSLKFCGYIIGQATGRDSGATLQENVACIKGNITSSGSVKNWATEATEGSLFRLQVPKLVLEKHKEYEDQTGNWIISSLICN